MPARHLGPPRPAEELVHALLEGRPALAVDQPGCRIGKLRIRISGRREALRLEEERPARAEAAQNVVEPRAGRDQLGLGGAFQIGPAEAECPLEAAVLVEHDPRRHQRRPWQMVGQPVRPVAVFGKVQHESQGL